MLRWPHIIIMCMLLQTTNRAGQDGRVRSSPAMLWKYLGLKHLTRDGFSMFEVIDVDKDWSTWLWDVPRVCKMFQQLLC